MPATGAAQEHQDHPKQNATGGPQFLQLTLITNVFFLFFTLAVIHDHTAHFSLFDFFSFE